MALNFVNHRNADGMEEVLEHVLLEDCKMNAKMLMIIFFICAKDPTCGILLGLGPGLFVCLFVYLLILMFVCLYNEFTIEQFVITSFTDILSYKHLQEY